MNYDQMYVEFFSILKLKNVNLNEDVNVGDLLENIYWYFVEKYWVIKCRFLKQNEYKNSHVHWWELLCCRRRSNLSDTDLQEMIFTEKHGQNGVVFVGGYIVFLGLISIL